MSFATECCWIDQWNVISFFGMPFNILDLELPFVKNLVSASSKIINKFAQREK